MQEKFNTDLILFDLDGTLIDTAPDFVTTLNQMLVRDGKKKLDLSSIRPFVSDGSSKMIKLGYGINQNDRNFENLQKDFLELYKENFLNKCNLFEGVNNILNFLNKNNIKFGIVTNKPKRFAIPVIKKFKILNGAKVIICPEDIRNTKPSPEGILLGCEKLNIQNDRVIYVGDHKKDLEAADSANVRSVGCLYGYGLKEKDHHGCYYIDNLNDLIGYIKN